jgi:6-phosphofructokinase 1
MLIDGIRLMSKPNLMIVQGGGPTAVFNTSLAEIIAEAQKQPTIAGIFGARFGIRGVIDDNIVDLSDVGAADLELLRHTPGAALGSSRHSPTTAEFDRVLANLRKHEIGQLLFLGGNGTMRGAELISASCAAQGLDIRIVGVPKTVDNDIAATDRCPGYASAARYIATATRELGADLRALPQPVTILETMGRGVGWVAAASCLARTDNASAPHLVYIPELPFDADDFISSLHRIVDELGWAVVVVAEGIRHADGSLVYETADAAQSDPLKRPMTGGVAQHLASLVGQRLGIRCRSEKPGLLGRASMALTSKQDLADAALVGRASVRALVSNETNVMVALDPLESSATTTHLVPLEKAAGHERTIPAEWLQTGPLPVNQKCLDYIGRLTGPIDNHIQSLGTAARAAGVR